MKLFLLSNIFLFLSIPLFSGESYGGISFWAWFSLLATSVYAITLITVIQTKWSELKGVDE